MLRTFEFFDRVERAAVVIEIAQSHHREQIAPWLTGKPDSMRA